MRPQRQQEQKRFLDESPSVPHSVRLIIARLKSWVRETGTRLDIYDASPPARRRGRMDRASRPPA
jgi:hypothetical protein